MVTLSLFSEHGEMAVSIAVQGILRAAVRRHLPIDGTAGAQVAMAQIVQDACHIAQISPERVDRVLIVTPSDSRCVSDHVARFSDVLPASRHDIIHHRDALLMLVGAAAPEDAGLVVFQEDVTALARKSAGQISQVRNIEGVKQLTDAATRLCRSLGASGLQPFTELAIHARGLEPDDDVDLQDVIQLMTDGSFSVNEELLGRRVVEADRRCLGALANPATIHSAVQRCRSGLATAFLRQLSDAVVELGRMWQKETRIECVSFGGSFLDTPEIASRVREKCGTATFAPISAGLGAALGGALVGHELLAPVHHLALGPHFDEQDVKQVLENCRLEYVYEPDWSRLCARVSRWLSTGALVGWFQGAVDFNRLSLGARSVLADPSNRYVRDNLNGYLLGRPIGATLPLALAPSAEQVTLIDSRSSPFLLFEHQVKPDAQVKLSAAVDAVGRCFMHTPTTLGAPELVKLLEAHYARTGVPGLLNVTLESTPGFAAENPRDAVRAAFGSAVDALVMSRFMIAKDYWLMRQAFN